MNRLEVLNAAATKQEHGVSVPLSLKISVAGAWHTISIDRDDKSMQKLARTMVMAMLRNEIEATSKEMNTCMATLKNAEEADNATLNDYLVEVETCRAGKHVRRGQITVCAHSGYDARVMAFILKGEVPEDATPEQICKMALDMTRLVGAKSCG